MRKQLKEKIKEIENKIDILEFIYLNPPIVKKGDIIDKQIITDVTPVIKIIRCVPYIKVIKYQYKTTNIETGEKECYIDDYFKAKTNLTEADKFIEKIHKQFKK